MRRGEISTGREAGSVTSEARPCLIVQSQNALPPGMFVTVCPLTTHLRGLGQIRIVIVPTPENGLERTSEVEVDLVTTIQTANIGRLLGTADPWTMRKVDEALRLWLAV